MKNPPLIRALLCLSFLVGSAAAGLAPATAKEPGQPDKTAPQWGTPFIGPFFTARIPAGWKDPFAEAPQPTVAQVQADFGGQSGRVLFDVIPIPQEPAQSDWFNLFRGQRITLSADPVRIKVGRLHGYEATGVETMLPGVNPGGKRGFLRAILVGKGSMYHVSCDCPAADLDKWIVSFQAVINSFRPR